MAAGLCTSTAHLELMCPLHLAGRLTAAPSPTPHFYKRADQTPPPHLPPVSDVISVPFCSPLLASNATAVARLGAHGGAADVALHQCAPSNRARASTPRARRKMRFLYSGPPRT